MSKTTKKPSSNAPVDLEPLIQSFESLGLPSAKAKATASSSKIASALSSLIDAPEIRLKDACLEEKKASLVLALASDKAFAKLDGKGKARIVSAIKDGRLERVDQVAAAAAFLISNRPEAERDDDAVFDQECGVGVTVTPSELASKVSTYLSTHYPSPPAGASPSTTNDPFERSEAAFSAWSSYGKILTGLRAESSLRWADAVGVKNEVDKQLEERFGKKDEVLKEAREREKAKSKSKADEKAAANAKGVKKEVAPPPRGSTVTPALPATLFQTGFLGQLHKPGGNADLQTKPELIEQHLKATGGKVYTRFPPEPNGFLHIGHAKAILVNFGYAAYHNGHCNLRYDDTNPAAEEQVYFDSILEIVRWLGFEPWKITYSSDNFEQLYEWATELVRRDKAYMCYCTEEQIKANRGGPISTKRTACEHRSRPVEESLDSFKKMREGHFEKGKAVLRFKGDLESGNPQMWDMIAYRIVPEPHHRTGATWTIYPTYDMTHSLCDAIENISHSLCTTEFILSRESYEWLNRSLDVYCPKQSEYGRLNLEGTVMSKRKILKLVKEKHVLGWDDPRMYTLIALKRRGIPPGAIISFISDLGVSTQKSEIPLHKFESSVRSYLETTTPRLHLVLEPIKITITNLDEDYIEMITKPIHRKDPSFGTNTVPFTRVVYIDRSDFRTEASADFFRLTPGGSVGLMDVPKPIKCLSYKQDPSTGVVTEIEAEYETSSNKKPKTFIHWIAEHAPSGSPVHIDEVRIFQQLFKSADPSAGGNYLDDIDTNSLQIVKGALLETGFWKITADSLADATEEAKKRTANAEEESAGASKAPELPADGQSDHATTTPKRDVSQLVGNEVVRFQAMRVAYFTLDKDAIIADAASGGRKDGDRIILNRIVSLKGEEDKAAA